MSWVYRTRLVVPDSSRIPVKSGVEAGGLMSSYELVLNICVKPEASYPPQVLLWKVVCVGVRVDVGEREAFPLWANERRFEREPGSAR